MNNSTLRKLNFKISYLDEIHRLNIALETYQDL